MNESSHMGSRRFDRRRLRAVAAGIKTPFRLPSHLLLATGAAVTRSASEILGDDVVEVSPQVMRDLMLSVERSIHGRFLEILGDDEAERVDTMGRLLEGSTVEDLNELVRVTQQAVIRLRQVG